MARQEVSRTTHIEEGELRVTHENAILTNITPTNPIPSYLKDIPDLHVASRIVGGSDASEGEFPHQVRVQ